MLSYSEIFISIEGEASGGFSNSFGHAGTPTIYLRLTGCNKTCAGFNNPNNKPTDSIDTLGFDPRKIQNIQQVPTIVHGCDSIYSWDEQFDHLWITAAADQIIDEFDKLLPHGWVHPVTGLEYILSLTGGEPLQNQKNLPELILHPKLKECRHILFETNGSVPLNQPMVDCLITWLSQDSKRKVTFSNSPKLSASGEKWKTSVKPKCIMDQYKIPNANIYFKFVCDNRDEMFEEVYKAMQEYYDAGVPKESLICIMPMACTEEQQKEITKQVALKCIQYGFVYCHRIQNSVFGNGVGT